MYLRLTSFLVSVLLLPFTVSAQCCLQFNDSVNNAQVINTFYPLLPNTILTPGSFNLQLGSVPSADQFGNSYGTTPINPGDVLMIIQMQGAGLNSSNSSLYGAGSSSVGPDNLGATGWTNLNNVGQYEFVIAQNAVPITGGNLEVSGGCSNGGIQNTYSNLEANSIDGQASFQVVRVPRFANLTLQQNLSTTAWNGSVGGILAFFVQDTLNFNGYSILSDGKGFRGGYQDVRPSGNSVAVYTTTDISQSSGKGEGVCGTPRFLWNGQNQVDNGPAWVGYPGGNYGRGAPGNAGGGGNIHNAGGGGGAGSGSGGVGGNAVVSFGTSVWPNGGRPGLGINASLDNLHFGGGGGGGDANNALTGVKGGAGGGIVFIKAGIILGTGTVNTSGSNGQVGVYNTAPDGAGGGGGGGNIVIFSESATNSATLNLLANGGNGGNTLNDGSDPHGPGGGGGGGKIFHYVPGAVINTQTAAGNSGLINNGNGSANGAQPGQPGQVVTITPSALYQNIPPAINPKPEADFSFGFVCQNDSFTFVDNSYCSPVNNNFIQSYSWDFGNGSSSTQSNPTHVYTVSGSYSVTLIVQSNAGCLDTMTKLLQVYSPYRDTIQVITCDSFLWNESGQSFTQSGFYEQAYSSVHGCDSIRVLDLTVNGTTFDTVTAAICSGSAFLFENNLYSTSGTYTSIFSNILGCDSIRVLQLVVNDTFFTSVSLSLCEGDIFVLPNGDTVSQSGIFSSNLSTANGCDSLFLHSISFIPLQHSTTSVTLCQGDSFLFNNVYYHQSGIYTDTFTAASGCDSISELQLTVNPIFSDTLSVSICSGSSYSFNGNTYNATGIYPNLFQSISGCDSLVWISLSITSVLYDTLPVSICQGDSYFFAGSLYSSPGFISSTFSSSTGCDSIVTLALTILPTSNFTDTVFSCSAYTWPVNGQTYTQSGAYSSLLTNAAGCDSLVILQLILPASPLTLLPAVITGESCPGVSDGALTVSASGGEVPYVYSWSSGLSASPEQLSLSPGTYGVTVTDALGCSLTADYTVNAGIRPDALVNGVNPDCSGSNGSVTVTLVSPCASCMYSINGGMFVSTAVFTGLSSGNYEVIVSDGTGCRDTVLQELVSPVVLGALLDATDVSCYNAADGSISVLINSGTSPYAYMWNNGSTAASVNGLSGGSYTVTVMDASGCELVLSSLLNEPAAPQLQLGPDIYICAPTYALTTGLGAPNVFLWNEGSVTSDIMVTQSGNYSVTVTDENGCSVTDEVNVQLFDSVSVSLPEEYVIYQGQSVTLSPVVTGGSGIGSWVWTPGGNLNCSTCSVVVSSPVTDIRYVVTYTDQSGCLAIEEVLIKVEGSGLYIPDAFTPNGDGQNDVFGVYGRGIRGVEWRVFNRWGEKVYETRNPADGWDGVYNGKLQPVGVYVYYALVTFESGKTESYQGSVTLIR